ncbi:hypothetical protein U1Q18_022526 [Sarracenia purpurea var. burkii]
MEGISTPLAEVSKDPMYHVYCDFSEKPLLSFEGTLKDKASHEHDVRGPSWADVLALKDKPMPFSGGLRLNYRSASAPGLGISGYVEAKHVAPCGTASDQLRRRFAAAPPAGSFVPPLTPARCSVLSLSPAEKASLLVKAVEGSGKQHISFSE